MQFKIDKNLRCVADSKRVKVGENMLPLVSRGLFQYCVKRGLFHERTGNVGKTVLALVFNRNVFDICEILSGYLGVRTIPADTFDAFCNLIIIE